MDKIKFASFVLFLCCCDTKLFLLFKSKCLKDLQPTLNPIEIVFLRCYTKKTSTHMLLHRLKKSDKQDTNINMYKGFFGSYVNGSIRCC